MLPRFSDPIYLVLLYLLRTIATPAD